MRSRYPRWRTPRAEPFASEKVLCDVLRSVAPALGWVAYPETGGWDVLLVLPDETQVGVQAKLRANVDVLAQSIVPSRRPGPDVHAVLVPSCSRAFRDVASALDVAVISGATLRGDGYDREVYEASSYPRGARYLEVVVTKAPRTTHVSGRCWLPPFVPDGDAGVPAPRSVSPWRIAAARLCAEIRAGATPSRAEIQAVGMNPGTWCGRWLESIPGTRPARYRQIPGVALPDVAFPEVSRGLGLPDPSRPAA